LTIYLIYFRRKIYSFLEKRAKAMSIPEYHVRPFPQQPKKGSAKLIHSLYDLEKALAIFPPDIKKLEAIQASIHATTQLMNDDKLVDLLRQLSMSMDEYMKTSHEDLPQKIFSQILKIRIELKHL
jgi:hypothetical protein